jgi:hypothetical protein
MYGGSCIGYLTRRGRFTRTRKLLLQDYIGFTRRSIQIFPTDSPPCALNMDHPIFRLVVTISRNTLSANHAECSRFHPLLLGLAVFVGFPAVCCYTFLRRHCFRNDGKAGSEPLDIWFFPGRQWIARPSADHRSTVSHVPSFGRLLASHPRSQLSLKSWIPSRLFGDPQQFLDTLAESLVTSHERSVSEHGICE